MRNPSFILGAGTLALGLSLSAPAICSETTAKPASAVGESAEDTKTQPTLGVASGWPNAAQADASGSPWGAVLMIFGVLIAAGATSFLVRRRRGGLERESLIEVLATKAVTPKTKIVLLAARNREVLLSVGDGGATLLTEWLADGGLAAPTAIGRAASEPELRFDAAIEMPVEPAAPRRPEPSLAVDDHAEVKAVRTPMPRQHSEAVAGLLELRRKAQHTPTSNAVMRSHVPTLDTDSAWTQRLMAEMQATKGRS